MYVFTSWIQKKIATLNADWQAASASTWTTQVSLHTFATLDIWAPNCSRMCEAKAAAPGWLVTHIREIRAPRDLNALYRTRLRASRQITFHLRPLAPSGLRQETCLHKWKLMFTPDRLCFTSCVSEVVWVLLEIFFHAGFGRSWKLFLRLIHLLMMWIIGLYDIEGTLGWSGS